MSDPAPEQLVRGFQFCEAPRFSARMGLTFSDLTGGGYHRRLPDGGTEVLLADRMWIGGAVPDRGDALVLSGKGGLVLLDGGRAVPLLSEIEGKPIGAVNDIEADGKGGLFGGTIDFAAILDRGEPPERGLLFHLAPGGTPRVLRDDVVGSNGLGFSPDGGTLYHAESTVGIWAWSLSDGEPAGAPVLFAPADDCDGLAVDAEGGVWVAFWREAVLRRYRADAVIDRELRLPFPAVTSLCFGGPGLTDLYVTTGASPERPDAGGVIRLRAEVPGLPIHHSAFASGDQHGP